LIRGLWLLLPHSSRAELWPATFAFGDALGFDAVVVPRLNLSDFPGYTTEQQASDYPPGRYELSLQTAAESGDQAALDSLFGRRSARDTLRLAVVMVAALSLMLLVFRLFDPFTPDTRPPEPLPPDAPVWSSSQRERAAIAAAIVSNPQPFSAVGLQEASRYRDAERAASAAALIGVRDPLAAAVQLRAAQARYVDIWKR
jgi:hypothetical protein